jgi:hypothetical protein
MHNSNQGAFGTTFLLDGGTYGMICMKAIISDDDDPYELNPEEEVFTCLVGHLNVRKYLGRNS